MLTKDPLKDLQVLVRSHYGIIVVDTDEEERAEGLLHHLADALRLPFFSWTRTKGLRREGMEQVIYGTADPSGALGHVEASHFPAIYHFQGLGDDLDNKDVAQRLRDAADQFSKSAGAIVLTGTGIALPDSVKALSSTLELPAPQLDDYRELLGNILRDLSFRTPIKPEMTADDTNRLLNNLKGLTLMEAQKILTKVIVEDGRLSPDDIREVVEAKKAIVEREGVLEYTPVEEKMSDVADLVGLKAWLSDRRAIIADPQKAVRFGLSFPKGVLLLGVPGCGKSLCAKAVSSEWGLPLLKLDPSNLYNKYIGESERNFKRAIALAEKVAPVVLWIDELEKAFSVGGGEEDGGVSQRIFGTFLSWLQDRKGDVFVVATANDVQKLPPEFLRKGRFDEIFFVDLPNADARAAVFRIQLNKRRQDPVLFNVPGLVQATDGFSGAEVEQVVISGLYSAFSAKKNLSTEILLDEILRTRPISLTLGDKIAWLREWAKDKTRSAQ